MRSIVKVRCPSRSLRLPVNEIMRKGPVSAAISATLSGLLEPAKVLKDVQETEAAAAGRANNKVGLQPPRDECQLAGNTVRHQVPWETSKVDARAGEDVFVAGGRNPRLGGHCRVRSGENALRAAPPRGDLTTAPKQRQGVHMGRSPLLDVIDGLANLANYPSALRQHLTREAGAQETAAA